jgi:hypothetical protein
VTLCADKSAQFHRAMTGYSEAHLLMQSVKC